MSKHFVRWTYEGSISKAFPSVPELVELGQGRFSEAYPLIEHHHEGAYEFVYIERGTATWEINGSNYQTSAGQVFHSRPGEWHRARLNFIEPCSLWWIILLDPGSKLEWLGLKSKDIIEISKVLDKLPRVIPADLKIRQSFRFLQDAILRPSPLSTMKIRHGIMDILFNLFHVPQPSAHSQDFQDAMNQLVHRIQLNPAQRWSNAEIAKSLGVSESHVYRLFRDMHGQSPAAFIDRERIEKARELLRHTNLSITQISMDLGYSTSQHFATVFKKYTGISPREWRSNSGSLL